MLMNNNEYIEIIETIKGEIRGAQYKACLLYTSDAADE